MNVLVLESEPGTGGSAVEQLATEGHRVFSCHDPGSPPFPCRALEGSGPCPLADPGIDVAVAVRAHDGDPPSSFEDGFGCALRARVPLVVAGPGDPNPYEGWADAVVEDHDMVEACEVVTHRPSRVHGPVAERALWEAMQRRAGGLHGASAAVWRDRDQLRVRLAGFDGLESLVCGLVVSDVAAALREFDPQTPKIDISIT